MDGFRRGGGMTPPVCKFHNLPMRQFNNPDRGWFCAKTVGLKDDGTKKFCSYRVPAGGEESTPAPRPSAAPAGKTSDTAPQAALLAAALIHQGHGEGTNAVVLLTAERMLEWIREKERK